MSGKEIISRLKVPSLSFIDKTPTPRVTPLLKAVDAIGLFREDEKLSAVSTSSSNNPFDETFRKALKENSSSNQVDHAVDDVLNTPQIISFPPSAPPSANVLCYSNKTSIVARDQQRKLVILPKSDTDTSQQVSISSVKRDDLEVLARRKRRRRQDALPQSKSAASIDIKERNKAAAKRSRLKKKNAAMNMQKTIQQLIRANKELVQENTMLKKEVSALRVELDQKRNMSSILLVPNTN